MRYYWNTLFLTFLFCFSLASHADSEEIKKFRGSVSVTRKSLENSNGITTDAIGGQLELQYGMKPAFGLNLGMKQLSLQTNGSVTGFSFGAHYSINALLHQKKSSKSVGEKTVVEKKSKNSQDVIFKAGLSQYLFNGTIAATGFFGYFVGADYLYPWNDLFSLQAGVSYDSVKNVGTIKILSLNAGVNFFF